MNIIEKDIWGPKYWYVLHKIVSTYPEHPTKPIRRKYYDFIMNIPMFLPDTDIGYDFQSLLDMYPVSSYLDSRNDLSRWMHFIHNQVNRNLDKPELGYEEAMEKLERITFYTDYSLKDNKLHLYISIIGFLCIVAYFVYSR